MDLLFWKDFYQLYTQHKFSQKQRAIVFYGYMCLHPENFSFFPQIANPVFLCGFRNQGTQFCGLWYPENTEFNWVSVLNFPASPPLGDPLYQFLLDGKVLPKSWLSNEKWNKIKPHLVPWKELLYFLRFLYLSSALHVAYIILCVCVLSHSDSLRTQGCSLPGSWSMGFSQAKILESYHFFLQGIFSTQESNLCLLHWQEDSLPLSQLGSPGKRLNG